MGNYTFGQRKQSYSENYHKDKREKNNMEVIEALCTRYKIGNHYVILMFSLNIYNVLDKGGNLCLNGLNL